MRKVFASLSLLYAGCNTYHLHESSLEYPEVMHAVGVLALAPAMVVFLLVCPWLANRKWADSLPAEIWISLLPCLAGMAVFSMLVSEISQVSFGRRDAEETLGLGMMVAPVVAMLVAVVYVLSWGVLSLSRCICQGNENASNK